MRVVRDDAPWCPWNIEFIRRINGLDDRRRRAPHRLRRRVPRARARRRVPRRAGRGAGRSAPPARDHQVQPGAHVDAGERGRHRRRVPVHLRHGGPGRLPVRRPHGAGVEPLRRAARTRPPTSRGCSASSTGSAGTRSAPTSCSSSGPTPHAGRLDAAHRRRHVLARRAPGVPRASDARDRARSASDAKRAFADERAAVGGSRASSRASTTCSSAPSPRATHELGDLPDGAFVVEAPLHGVRGAAARRSEGDRIAPGDRGRDARGDEDGVAVPVRQPRVGMCTVLRGRDRHRVVLVADGARRARRRRPSRDADGTRGRDRARAVARRSSRLITAPDERSDGASTSARGRGRCRSPACRSR